MPVRRVSPAVLLYVALALAQAAAVLIAGGGSLSIPAALLSLVLFAGLALGRPIAWVLLLALNSVGLIAWAVVLLVHLGGHILWGNVLVIGLSTIAMELALLSPGMRRHVASRGWRVNPVSAAADSPSARPGPPRESASRRSSAAPRRRADPATERSRSR